MSNTTEQVFKKMKRLTEDNFNLARSSGERRILIAVMSEMQQIELEYPEGHENKISRTFEYVEKLTDDMVGNGKRIERIALKDLLKEFQAFNEPQEKGENDNV
jgi:hypothetical protein